MKESSSIVVAIHEREMNELLNIACFGHLRFCLCTLHAVSFLSVVKWNNNASFETSAENFVYYRRTEKLRLLSTKE